MPKHTYVFAQYSQHVDVTYEVTCQKCFQVDSMGRCTKRDFIEDLVLGGWKPDKIGLICPDCVQAAK